MPTTDPLKTPLGSKDEADATTGADAAARAQDAAQQAAAQAQEKAQQAASRAQDKLREQIDQRSAQAAEQISEQASDLRSVSEALRNEGKNGPADAADRLADYAEKASAYLHQKDSYALLSDAENLGRQRPWAAVAGGLAIGLAASRFLKASSSRRYQTQSATAQPAPGYGVPSDGESLELGYAGTSGYSVPPVSANAAPVPVA